jgi:hypothetical protein
MTNQIENQYRHGDVLLHPLDDKGRRLTETVEPPADAERLDRVILAYGEATGSAHVLTGDVTVWDAGGQRYVRIGDGGATLVQERFGKVLDAPDGHAPEQIAPGEILRYIPQREQTPDGEWVRVAD